MGGTLHAAWLGGSRTGVVAIKMARIPTAQVPWTNFSHPSQACAAPAPLHANGWLKAAEQGACKDSRPTWQRYFLSEPGNAFDILARTLHSPAADGAHTILQHLGAALVLIPHQNGPGEGAAGQLLQDLQNCR